MCFVDVGSIAINDVTNPAEQAKKWIKKMEMANGLANDLASTVLADESVNDPSGARLSVDDRNKLRWGTGIMLT